MHIILRMVRCVGGVYVGGLWRNSVQLDFCGITMNCLDKNPLVP